MRHTITRLSGTALVAAAVLLGTAPAAGAQEQAKPPAKHDGHNMAGHHGSGWKEMDAFHATLAATYHPVAEKKDLAPLKSKAGDLASAAERWAASPVPASCKPAESKPKVEALAKEAAALAALVKGGATDAALTTAITTLHDNFERLEQACGGHAGMKH